MRIDVRRDPLASRYPLSYHVVCYSRTLLLQSGPWISRVRQHRLIVPKDVRRILHRDTPSVPTKNTFKFSNMNEFIRSSNNNSTSSSSSNGINNNSGERKKSDFIRDESCFAVKKIFNLFMPKECIFDEYINPEEAVRRKGQSSKRVAHIWLFCQSNCERQFLQIFQPFYSDRLLTRGIPQSNLWASFLIKNVLPFLTFRIRVLPFPLSSSIS
jgi:hypothetical protein